jgi:hypothetical protein
LEVLQGSVTGLKGTRRKERGDEKEGGMELGKEL